ncbi:tRNA threonylcarbamoyladenosine biosynthesis protein TsaE [Virgibacillus natechei]|uniref:tRNA threonylcarbamoyladenosine biosynthesis protein TsaE n=1 Tax=Virgibacillus natechei TaxID=1216297 RepID=A0ABS4IL59_9BACI|nr:tRNA (adenosine(37)-N6)-threonylcarbamoyltransferase complex ATPase subunit type 1 TsaE [Virgibacillus natechei]MBP1971671.1 tRNA threonylcarbamoyladenosine biosynthesis protein TsaE [Virgibacillus natechei]UZD13842.1 tRNA (adenosine(37)-N6)-threonylcarbamoyltransferase complex ATPase subunit type 1 TsaE [Virgibacillus natechei]
MTEYELQSSTDSETMQIGERLALLLKPGDVITLDGELGAGKTTFTKGIANGLGVKNTISSPTFTIVKEYEGDLPLYHMDAYRLENSDEDIGFDEYFYGDGISVVEWSTYIEEFLPEKRLTITIRYGNGNARYLKFTPVGNYYKSITDKLRDTNL